MTATVIKKNGMEEDFIREKLVVSAVKAGAPLKFAREVARDIEKETEGEVRSETLREKILNRLEEEEPEWKENWLTYDRAVKKL